MKRYVRIGCVLGMSVLVMACPQKSDKKAQPATEGAKAGSADTTPGPAKDTAAITKNELQAFGALPVAYSSTENPATKAKEDLGRMLYFEKRLSKNHDISCNSCHGLDTFGVDNKAVSVGHRDQKGARNSPTVYNAAGHFRQFWDGREPDVEAQAKGPILNPVEMAMKDGDSVVAVLKSIPGYEAAFKAAFPTAKEALTYDNVGRAIGAFERKLVTPAPWDRFIKGDKRALTVAQKQGFKTFVTAGCPMCHSGALLGGTLYQKLGLIHPWPSQKDQGRFDVSKKPEEKMMFKVPSLRNIAKTGPYFHDGSVADLNKAVTMMAWHQLSKKLGDKEVASIVAFMGALTGELPKAYIKEPQLPKSGPKTPKPDPK